MTLVPLFPFANPQVEGSLLHLFHLSGLDLLSFSRDLAQATFPFLFRAHFQNVITHSILHGFL